MSLIQSVNEAKILNVTCLLLSSAFIFIAPFTSMYASLKSRRLRFSIVVLNLILLFDLWLLFQGYLFLFVFLLMPNLSEFALLVPWIYLTLLVIQLLYFFRVDFTHILQSFRVFPEQSIKWNSEFSESTRLISGFSKFSGFARHPGVLFEAVLIISVVSMKNDNYWRKILDTKIVSIAKTC